MAAAVHLHACTECLLLAQTALRSCPSCLERQEIYDKLIGVRWSKYLCSEISIRILFSSVRSCMFKTSTAKEVAISIIAAAPDSRKCRTGRSDVGILFILAW